jgi:methanogenic corrinoid protein MtbC1
VSHSSLRFLEREGLIQATRTTGGHRLYRPADVERIRQIKGWQAQRLSLDEIRRRLEQFDRLPAPPDLADAFLRHAIAGERVEAMEVILAADEAGLPLARLLGEVLQPALIEVGLRWEDGRLLVAQEKEISELVRDVVAELTARHAAPDLHGPSIVAACVAGERHELGMRMVAALLRAAGHPLYYLGADVESRFILEAVRLHRPDLVLLSVKLEPNLLAVKEALRALETGLAPEARPPVIVGGQIAIAQPDLLRSWGAIPAERQHPDAVFDVLANALTDSATATEDRGKP